MQVVFKVSLLLEMLSVISSFTIQAYVRQSQCITATRMRDTFYVDLLMSKLDNASPKTLYEKLTDTAANCTNCALMTDANLLCSSICCWIGMLATRACRILFTLYVAHL